MLKTRPHIKSVQRLPPSAHLKEAIQYALEEVWALHHNYVGTEHILLGRVRNSGAGGAIA